MFPAVNPVRDYLRAGRRDREFLRACFDNGERQLTKKPEG